MGETWIRQMKIGGSSGRSGRFREEFDPPLGEVGVVEGGDGVTATHSDQSGAAGSGHAEWLCTNGACEQP